MTAKARDGLCGNRRGGWGCGISEHDLRACTWQRERAEREGRREKATIERSAAEHASGSRCEAPSLSRRPVLCCPVERRRPAPRSAATTCIRRELITDMRSARKGRSRTRVERHPIRFPGSRWVGYRECAGVRASPRRGSARTAFALCHSSRGMPAREACSILNRGVPRSGSHAWRCRVCGVRVAVPPST